MEVERLQDLDGHEFVTYRYPSGQLQTVIDLSSSMEYYENYTEEKDFYMTCNPTGLDQTWYEDLKIRLSYKPMSHYIQELEDLIKLKALLRP